MYNVVLTTTTVLILALGMASGFAADGHGDSQAGAQQSGNSNQIPGVANRGNGGCANFLANPAAHSKAAIAYCRIRNV